MRDHDREAITHVDGTFMFANEADAANEAEVAQRLGMSWSCEMRRFGALSPIDWFAVRDERLVGVAELKCRTHPLVERRTTIISLRKWMALMLAEQGLGTPGVLVSRWSCGAIRWIPVREIPTSCVRVTGRHRAVTTRSEIEPLIIFDVDLMRELEVS